MAAGSAGLLFINGIGALAGPMITGWLMGMIGPHGFWVYILTLMALLAVYAAWRMTRRPALAPEEQGSFAVISPTATTLAVEAALDEAQSHDPGPAPQG